MEVGSGRLHGGLHGTTEVLLRLHYLEGVGCKGSSRSAELELAVEHHESVVTIGYVCDDSATHELLVGLGS